MHVNFRQLDGAGITAKRLRKYGILLSLIVLASLTSACQDKSPVHNPVLPDSYEVDPVFKEFYEHLGGVQVLGPAISPLFVHDDINYQYTVAALMVQDPFAPTGMHYSLAGLGLELGIAEPPVAAPGNDKYYLNGHIVAEPFIPMFEKLGGERYVGRPITEMHYNPDKERFEQHFEKLGMFLLQGGDEQDVGLQAYGAWKCNVSCRQPQLGASTVSIVYRVAEVFAPTVERLGAEFTGSAITGAYRTVEGDTEQVFRNVVLVAVRGDSRQVFLRDVTRRIGMNPEPLAARSGDPQMYFYSTEAGGKLGYNVPLRFLDYLSHHGGRGVSGPPIAELKQVGEGLFQQCFTNLCLEETIDADGNSKISPMHLGLTYKLWLLKPGNEQTPQVQTPLPSPETALPDPQVLDTAPLEQGNEASEASSPTPESQATSPPEISIQVWENQPWVSSTQSQEIGVSVFADGLPLAGQKPELVIFLPDGARMVYPMQPTDTEGLTEQLIEPIEAPNGTLIVYQACISNSSGGKFCVRKAFLIWQSP